MGIDTSVVRIYEGAVARAREREIERVGGGAHGLWRPQITWLLFYRLPSRDPSKYVSLAWSLLSLRTAKFCCCCDTPRCTPTRSSRQPRTFFSSFSLAFFTIFFFYFFFLSQGAFSRLFLVAHSAYRRFLSASSRITPWHTASFLFSLIPSFLSFSHRSSGINPPSAGNSERTTALPPDCGRISGRAPTPWRSKRHTAALTDPGPSHFEKYPAKRFGRRSSFAATITEDPNCLSH